MSNSMTRQHFIAIAGALRVSRPIVKVRKNSPTYKQWKRCVVNIGIELYSFNSAFNQYRFYEACGMED